MMQQYPNWSNVHYGALGHDTEYVRVGKKKAGHLLDGKEWRQMPSRP